MLHGGALAGVGGPAADASIDGANAIAFDASGGFYLAGFDTKALLYVTPGGTMTLPYGNAPFYPRGNAGLATAPDGSAIAMIAIERNGDGSCGYAGAIPCSTSGLQGYALRVLPKNPDLTNPFEPGLIHWAQ